MINQKAIVLCFVALMTVGASAVVLDTFANTATSADPVVPDGYISISTPQELAKIGNDLAYPLNGKYYLSNDIVFTSSDDLNGGIDIGISATVIGSSLTVKLTPSSGSVTPFNAWLGTSSAQSTGSTVTLYGIPSGTYVLTVGGTAGGNPFAYSIQIDTTTSGEKTSGVTFNSNGNFSPIGSSSDPFTGIFDGNGNEIKGMNVSVFSSTSYANAGLFGYVKGAAIRNLGVVDSTVTATSSSPSYGAYAGGIAGYCGSTAVIENCYNTGNVSASSSSYSAYAGGIAGYCSSAVIENCYNTGSVTATASSSSPYSAYAGGIAGYCSSAVVIENCYFPEGKVSHNMIFENKICGDLADPSSILRDGGTGNQKSGAKTKDQMTPTLEEARNGDSIYFIGTGGWNFGEYGVWIIVAGENNGYPMLLSLAEPAVSGGYVPISPYTPSTIIPDGYTAVYSFEQLKAINTNSTTLGGKYILMNDITFTEENNAAFVPIGNSSTPFRGIFDGNGYEIRGMSIGVESTSYAYAGLFGYVDGAAIRNLGVVDSTVTASSYGISARAHAGGIAGCCYSTVIENCYNTGSVTASATSSSGTYAYAGGIAGNCYSTVIENCYNTGNVAATSSPSHAYAGGIAGCLSSAVIENCYNTGSVAATSSSDAYAGGIAGYLNSAAVIENCYNTGNVSASKTSSLSSSGAYAGGIAGYLNSAAVIENCYNTGNVSASSGTYAYAGGIGGYCSSAVVIKNCYFLRGKVSNNAIFEDVMCGNLADPSSVLRDGGTGDRASGAKTKEQMTPTLEEARNGNSIYFIGTGGWNFGESGVWTIVEGVNDGYPILRSLGQVVPGTPSYNVELTPGAGYTLTPEGSSSSPVDSGGSFSFTMTADPGYTLNRVFKVTVNGVPWTPAEGTYADGVYTLANIIEDKTVAVTFPPTIESSSDYNGGTSVDIDGTVDPSAGATYVKVYITFSDGSVISSSFSIGSIGEFSFGYSGSMQPTSYLVTAYDGKPGMTGSNMVAWAITVNIEG